MDINNSNGIKELLRKSGHHSAPESLKSEIMASVSTLSESKLRPVKIPVWIVAGVPLVLLLCIVLVLVFATDGNSEPATEMAHWLNAFSESLSRWIANIPTEIETQSLVFSDNLLILIGSGLILFWLFLGLYHFLSRSSVFRSETSSV
jgi:hypothetical protein